MQRVFFEKKPSLKITGKTFKVLVGNPSYLEVYLVLSTMARKSITGIVGEKMEVHMTTKGPCLVFPERNGGDITLCESPGEPLKGFTGTLGPERIFSRRETIDAHTPESVVVARDTERYRALAQEIHNEVYEDIRRLEAQTSYGVTTSELSALISRNLARRGLLAQTRRAMREPARFSEILPGTSYYEFRGDTYTARQRPREDAPSNRRTLRSRDSYVSPREVAEGNTSTPSPSLMSLLSRAT